MADKRYKVLGELPRLVPAVKRFRAEHASTGRALELRSVAVPGDSTCRQAFEQERDDLLRLDHPAFPPVLDVGETRDVPYYVTPLRELRPLAEVVKRRSYGPHEALRVADAWSSALAAAHLAGLVLGPPSPLLLGWDRFHGRLALVHPRAPEPVPVLPLPEEAPVDARRGAAWTSRGDVFHWGWLALWLATVQARPPEEMSLRLRVGTQAPELSVARAQLIAACLSEDSKLRPAHACEVRALLLELPRIEAARPPESPEAAAQVLARSLEVLREDGRVPDPAALASSTPTRKSAAPPRGPGRAVAALGVLGLAGAAWLGLRTPASPPQPPAPAGSATPSRLQLLARIETVSPASFHRLHRTAVRYAVERRLPEELRDLARLEAMAGAFEADPGLGCKQLEGFLGDLRAALAAEGAGPPGES